MHITLTGNLGSGKSTICKILEEKYSFEIYSTGVVQRKLAEELGITVLEMNRRMRLDPSFDHMIDNTVTRISKENPDSRLVFDSRLAWHFAENSFKVFLSVNIDEAARRVFAANRGKVEKYNSVEDAKAKLTERAKEEDIRYKEIYGLDYFSFSNYNLVLDSTCCPPEFLAERILEELKLYTEKSGFYAAGSCKVLMSPCRIRDTKAALSPAAADILPDTVPYNTQLLLPCKKDGDDFVSVAEKSQNDFVRNEKLPLVQIVL